MFHVATSENSSTVTRPGAEQPQPDLPEDAELARAVDARRLEEGVGDGVGRVDPHQVDPERAHQRRQDDRPRGVGEAGLGEQQVGREGQRRERDHDRAEGDAEERVASRGSRTSRTRSRPSSPEAVAPPAVTTRVDDACSASSAGRRRRRIVNSVCRLSTSENSSPNHRPNVENRSRCRLVDETNSHHSGRRK